MVCFGGEIGRERARPGRREGGENDTGLKRHLNEGEYTRHKVIWGERFFMEAAKKETKGN